MLVRRAARPHGHQMRPIFSNDVHALVQAPKGLAPFLWKVHYPGRACSPSPLHSGKRHRVKHRILIVEDHPYQLQVLVDLFSSQPGVEVEACSSAGEAAVRCLSRHYDLVVSDLKMPGMDGIQFIQRLSALPHPPPIALVSTERGRMLASARLAAQSLGLSVVGVLRKPVQAASIALLLEDLASVQMRRRRGGAALSTEPEDPVLREALKDGRITAWFQPKVCLRSGRTVGAEALARWVSADDGVLPPAAFLPGIIRLGLEKALLQRVLATGIDAQRQWQAAGHRISVSVNLPTHLLGEPNLPDELLAFVQERGGDPEGLCFELLEDSMTGHLSDYHAGTCRLRMKGFALAQDDFGQGMSSVHGLVNTPFTEIKIDRTLVDGCSRDAALRMTLENVIALIHQLGMNSVAEGVETKEDLDVLRRLDCDVVQGYLISRPLPAGEFARFLARST